MRRRVCVLLTVATFAVLSESPSSPCEKLMLGRLAAGYTWAALQVLRVEVRLPSLGTFTWLICRYMLLMVRRDATVIPERELTSIPCNARELGFRENSLPKPRSHGQNLVRQVWKGRICMLSLTLLFLLSRFNRAKTSCIGTMVISLGHRIHTQLLCLSCEYVWISRLILAFWCFLSDLGMQSGISWICHLPITFSLRPRVRPSHIPT